MAINWASVAKNASKAIRSVGSKLNFSYQDTPVSNDVDGSVISTTVEYSAYGVLDNINKSFIDRFGANNIESGDMALYIEVTPGAVEPEAGHKVQAGSHKFRLVQVQPISPALTPVLFIAQVRR